jgi:hypothetical protein
VKFLLNVVKLLQNHEYMKDPEIGSKHVGKSEMSVNIRLC